MSFYFELKLSPNQINMLMYFVNAAKKKNPEPMPKGTYATTAVSLVKEGLLEVEKDQDLKINSKWRITRKGFLAAEIIGEEVKCLKLPRNVPKHLFWYDLPKGATQCRGIGGSEPQGEIVDHERG